MRARLACLSLPLNRKERLNAWVRTLNFPLTGGTGRFKGMTGTGVSKNIGNGDDSDVVIKLH